MPPTINRIGQLARMRQRNLPVVVPVQFTCPLHSVALYVPVSTGTATQSELRNERTPHVRMRRWAKHRSWPKTDHIDRPPTITSQEGGHVPRPPSCCAVEYVDTQQHGKIPVFAHRFCGRRSRQPVFDVDKRADVSRPPALPHPGRFFETGRN